MYFINIVINISSILHNRFGGKICGFSEHKTKSLVLDFEIYLQEFCLCCNISDCLKCTMCPKIKPKLLESVGLVEVAFENRFNLDFLSGRQKSDTVASSISKPK